MKEDSSLQALFIDWQGTLTDGVYWHHLENPEHKNHKYFSPLRRGLMDGIWDKYRNSWMRGQTVSEEVIREVADKTGIDYSLAFEEFVHSSGSMPIKSTSVLDIIQQIRDKQVPVIIATDNTDAFSRWTVPGLQLRHHFDGILNSFDIRARKPDSGKFGESLFFNPYWSAHNLAPNQTALLDDSPDKNGRIGKFGIKYIQVSPQGGLLTELQRINKELE